MPVPNEGTIHVKIADIKMDDRARADLGDIINLAKSIKAIGLINPIIIDKDNNLIQGRRRIEALIILKRETIEARRYEELSAFERKRIELEEEIIHKKQMEWQEEVKLKQQLHTLYLASHVDVKREMRGPKAWGQKETAAVLGISTSSLSDDLRLADAIAQFPELEKIKSKRDALRKMYRLREIALIQELARRKIERGEGQDENVMLALGDALELIKNVEDESIDAVITDPPWGIDLLELGGSRSREYEMFDDNMAVGARLYKKIIPDLFRVMKKGAHLWLFFGIEHYERILKWLKDAGFDVRTSPCVWVKEGPSFSNFEYKPMPRYELFFFAVKPVPDGSPNRLLEPVSDVFDYSRATGGDKIHPTEKPVDFMKRLVTLSTHSDQLVLDPFAGSASTLIAALLTKRQAVGFELSPDYYAAADQRIKKYQVKMFEAELGLPVDGDEEVEE